MQTLRSFSYDCREYPALAHIYMTLASPIMGRPTHSSSSYAKLMSLFQKKSVCCWITNVGPALRETLAYLSLWLTYYISLFLSVDHRILKVAHGFIPAWVYSHTVHINLPARMIILHLHKWLQRRIGANKHASYRDHITIEDIRCHDMALVLDHTTTSSPVPEQEDYDTTSRPRRNIVYTFRSLHWRPSWLTCIH